jgi:multisubunit Na+/H+ antiporter MnhF subunit
MTTIPDSSVPPDAEQKPWSRLIVRETWASVAITVIWLTVLVDAIYGPNIVTSSAGGDQSTIPSAVIVSIFAFLATWVVARYGLRGEKS